MSDLEVPLRSILPAFRGVVPSPVATASSDGTPNITYVSSVAFVDDERIAFSNQFMSKTAENLKACPFITIRVVDPGTLLEYDLTATHLESETSGEVFESVRATVDAIASQTGMAGVFRVRSVEICRVDECRLVSGSVGKVQATQSSPDAIAALSVFVRRLDECRDLAEVTRRGLESIDDLFGFAHSMLLRVDEDEKKLFVVDHNGYGHLGAAAEVPIGEGVIGIAANRRRQVLVTQLTREMVLSAAMKGSTTQDRSAIPLPGLDSAQSLVASPLLLSDRCIGVLFLDSAQPNRFDTAAGQLIEVLASHLAAKIGLHEESGGTDLVSPPSESTGQSLDALPSREVRFYETNGTVLIDGDYVIKGVAGRILFEILEENARSGRTRFTNRELRLNNAIDLPPGNDNLEARLLSLRRRLEERSDPFRLERVGRGQLELRLDSPTNLRRESAGEPKTLL